MRYAKDLGGLRSASGSIPGGAELAVPTGCRPTPTSGRVAEENKRTAPQQAFPVPQHEPLQPPDGTAGMVLESTEASSAGAAARSASADLIRIGKTIGKSDRNAMRCVIMTGMGLRNAWHELCRDQNGRCPEQCRKLSLQSHKIDHIISSVAEDGFPVLT